MFDLYIELALKLIEPFTETHTLEKSAAFFYVYINFPKLHLYEVINDLNGAFMIEKTCLIGSNIYLINANTQKIFDKVHFF